MRPKIRSFSRLYPIRRSMRQLRFHTRTRSLRGTNNRYQCKLPTSDVRERRVQTSILTVLLFIRTDKPGTFIVLSRYKYLSLLTLATFYQSISACPGRGKEGEEILSIRYRDVIDLGNELDSLSLSLSH